MLRNDWSREEIASLFELPFNDLMFQAQTVHRQNFDANSIQVSTLLSIKTGNCPEDCDYCSQSVHHQTALVPEKKIAIEKVIEAARAARDSGASRFCMGAAWRNPHERDMLYVIDLVKEVKSMGLETCMTLGMLTSNQAERLADAGLDYYNHNLDTSREHYAHIIRTRTFDDRLDTLAHVRASGMKVCSGGIVGLGESRSDRVGLLHELATLPIHPQSVPLNLLVAVKGTPLGETPQLPVLEWIKSIAVARIIMPKSYVRLSAGREGLSDSEQAMAFLAGANSIFYGEKLLTTPNADSTRDDHLFETLGLHREAPRVDVKATAKNAMGV